jgi:hypothetical protein
MDKLKSSNQRELQTRFIIATQMSAPVWDSEAVMEFKIVKCIDMSRSMVMKEFDCLSRSDTTSLEWERVCYLL